MSTVPEQWVAALTELGIVAGSLAGFAVAFGLALLVTRPPAPRPAPGGGEPGTEPPAVAGFVVSGWRVTGDAVAGTLLDLAARGQVELRQPGADPARTAVAVLPADRRGLLPYERRVLDRIGEVAAGGPAALLALPFRDRRESRVWWRRLRREVAADARARGLSRRRFGLGVRSALTVVAAFAAIGVGHAVIRYVERTSGTDGGAEAGITALVAAFVGLTVLTRRDVGERDTEAGRAAAARWSAVRESSRAFAQLPPAAVAVHQRRLAYAAALGVARSTTQVIDFGMSSRRRVWSSYGGSWRLVRVHYPRRGRYGLKTRTLLGRGCFALAAGIALVVAPTQLGYVAGVSPGWLPALPGAGALLAVIGTHTVLRTLVDTFTARTVTGQVLWRQLWRTHSPTSQNRHPYLYHLAVDDGRSERTTAWVLPAYFGDGCRPGDTVTVTVRPWSRRVLDLHREPRPEPAAPAAATGPAPDRRLRFALDARDVAAALGLPDPARLTAVPGASGVTEYVTGDGARPLLVIQVATGAFADVGWRVASRGTPVAGTPDAYVNADRAAVRRGDTTVLLRAGGPAIAPQALAGLARLVAAQLEPHTVRTA
ncbi:DUF2207 family protein [Phytohabitans suffuscus]|uniref:Predicted membrane protein YciQ-like C-terminal domain-containing protein n=1 Tax=Phytohabitans suffuscus TaxID=624315 RepID=A0A6F8YTM8_9ACTN|nr:DUF2207 domain-containing protein [Phytohabitans suffuscus]BCB89472.1 hypothetical protein Psuf_067850 [Phytohabitans suffuscus]